MTATCRPRCFALRPLHQNRRLVRAAEESALGGHRGRSAEMHRTPRRRSRVKSAVPRSRRSGVVLAAVARRFLAGGPTVRPANSLGSEIR